MFWFGLMVCLTFCCRGRWLPLCFPLSRCFARSCAAAPKFLHSSRPLVKYPVLGEDRLPQWAVPALGWMAVQASRGRVGTLRGALWSPFPAQLTSPRTSMAREPMGSQCKTRERPRGHVSGMPLSCRRCPALSRARPLPALTKPASEPTSDTATATPIHTCEGPLQAQSASAAQATFRAARGVPSEGSPSGRLFPQRPFVQGTPRSQVPLCSTACLQAPPGIASTNATVVGWWSSCLAPRRAGACVAPRLCDFLLLFFLFVLPFV